MQRPAASIHGTESIPRIKPCSGVDACTLSQTGEHLRWRTNPRATGFGLVLPEKDSYNQINRWTGPDGPLGTPCHRKANGPIAAQNCRILCDRTGGTSTALPLLKSLATLERAGSRERVETRSMFPHLENRSAQCSTRFAGRIRPETHKRESDKSFSRSNHEEYVRSFRS